MEDNNQDKKPLFPLDRNTVLFLLTMVDAFLLFTVFLVGFFWYQANRQLAAINDQIQILQGRLKTFEQIEQKPESLKESNNTANLSECLERIEKKEIEFTEQDTLKVKEIKDRHEKSLMSIPGVVGVSIGLTENCKVGIYLNTEKENLSEVKKRAPQMVENIPVEVEEIRVQVPY